MTTSDEIRRLEAQANRSFTGDAWHGPSVLEALEDVTPSEATAHPIAGAHSIAELVAHLDEGYRIILARAEGRGAPIPESAWWPEAPSALNEAAWRAMLSRLRESAAALHRAIAAFPVNRLDEPLYAGGGTAINNLAGAAQHNAYHAGQIMLLKKMQRVPTSV